MKRPVERHDGDAGRKRATAATLSTACVLAATLVAAPADAADGDPATIGIETRLQHDTNLFALPDGVSPGTGPRAATTWTTDLGFHLDKSYGQQRFFADATVDRYQYAPYSSLDFTGYRLSALWLWSLTPSITGAFIFRQIEQPNAFSDVGFTLTTSSLRIDDQRFEVSWKPGSAIHPKLALLNEEVVTEIQTLQRQGSKTTSVELSGIYEFRSQNTAEFYSRWGRGRYPGQGLDQTTQIATRYDESENGLRAHQQLTGATLLDGNIGFFRRRHDDFPSRNFSGIVGHIDYRFIPTGKTEYKLSLSRSLNNTQTDISSYAQDSTVSFGPIWHATGLIDVKPSIGYTRRVYRGAIVPVVDNLREYYRTYALEADWALLRSLDLSVSVGRSSRTSNTASLQFIDRTAYVNARFRF